MKKLSLINVHDYPSRAQYDFAHRAAALLADGATPSEAAEAMRDARGVAPDPGAVVMAAGKWGDAPAWYSAYWEIGITQAAPHHWQARLISYSTGETLDTAAGSADTEDDARRASQQWVLDRIEEYREVPA